MSRFVEVICRNGVDVFPDLNESDMKDFGPSLTRQSDAEGTDINRIMMQYERTGTLPVMRAQALYDDVSSGLDYRQALEQVDAAAELFLSMPAKVRNRFNNDPALFLDYFQEPGHEEELVDLGLKEAPPAKPATP